MRAMLIVAGAAASLLSLGAQAQTMKAGLWEIKTQAQLDPKHQAQIEKAQQQMAALPPEQREMMQKMMAQRGISIDLSGGAAMTVKVCISEEQAKRNMAPVGTKGNCTHENQRSGNTIHAHFSCTDPASEGDSEVTLHGSDGFSAKTHAITHGKDGQTGTVDANADGRWLGSDCGGLKPVDSK